MDDVRALNTRESYRNKRFRFQRLKERAANVDVGLSRKVLPDHEVEVLPEGGEDSCFLKDELELLSTREVGENFIAFRNELAPKCQSMALLVHHLEEIVDIFHRYLTVENDFQVLELLKLLKVLGRDTRQKLTPFLSNIMKDCFDLLKVQDVKLCGQIFDTVGSLMLLLSKELLRVDPDLQILRNWYVTLIGHRRDYIRRYSAEAFAPIIRKLSSTALRRQLRLLIVNLVGRNTSKRHPENQANLVDGVARLNFNIVRNVKMQFHSKAGEVVPLFLSYCRPNEKDSEGDNIERYKLLEKTFFLMLEYTNRGHSQLLWDVLLLELQKSIKKELHEHTSEVAKCLNKCVEHRWGTRIEEGIPGALFDRAIKPLFTSAGSIHANSFGLVLSLWKYCLKKNLDTADDIENFLLKNMGTIEKKSPDELLAFYLDLFESLDESAVLTSFFEPGMEFCERNVKSKTHSCMKLVTLIGKLQKDSNIERYTQISQVVKEYVESDSEEKIWLACQCLQFSEGNDVLVELSLNKSSSEFIRSTALQSMSLKTLNEKVAEKIYDFSLKTLRSNPSHAGLLESFASFSCQHCKQMLKFETMFDIVGLNLMSKYHNVRLASLKILDACPGKLMMLQNDTDEDSEIVKQVCDIPGSLLEIEMLPVEFSEERKRQRLWSNLESLIRAKRIPEQYLKLLTLHIFGQYYIKFKPAWEMLTKVLVTLSEFHFRTIVWDKLRQHLEFVVTETENSSSNIDNDDTGSFSNVLSQYNQNDSSMCAQYMDVYKSTFDMLLQLKTNVESKSKHIMPHFWVFLRDEYYGSDNRDELDSDLGMLGDIDISSGKCSRSEGKISGMKLLCWFKLLSAFQNPRVTSGSAALEIIFTRFLTKVYPAQMPKLALEGLLKFKHPYMIPYKDSLLALTEDENFREEMTKFQFQDSVVSPEHRVDLIPIVTRILYGRLLIRKGKSSKDKFSISNMRSVVLAFFSGLKSEELLTLFQLIFRPFPSYRFVPIDSEQRVEEAIKELAAGEVIYARNMGFTRMISDVVKQLGVHADAYLDHILVTLIAISKVEYNVEIVNKKLLLELRRTVLKNFARLFEQYPNHDYQLWQKHFISLFSSASEKLPSATCSGNTPPPLLEIAAILSEYEPLRKWAYSSAWWPQLLIQCIKGITGGTSIQSLSLILTIVENLLLEENHLLIENIPLLLNQMLVRFQVSSASGGISTGMNRVIRTGSVSTTELTVSKRELEILSAISKLHSKIDSETAEKLITLLVPFLKRFGARVGSDSSYHRRQTHGHSSDLRGNVLGSVSNLIGSLDHPKKHVPFFSRLLGPFGTDPINDPAARHKLIAVFKAMELDPAARILEKMNAWDKTRVATYDFDSRLGAYEEIGASKLSKESLIAITYQVLTDMHDSEYPIRSAAFNMLCSSVLTPSKESEEILQSVLASVVMPGIRHGIKSHDPQARRGFIKLIAEIVKHSNHSDNCKPWKGDKYESLLHIDLIRISNLDDPEADFFANIIHSQMHRRVRALQRLNKNVEAQNLSVNTLVHIILPIATHALYESTKNTEQGYMNEGIALLGKLAKLLPWSHYSKLLCQLLEAVSKKPLLEKRLLKATCLVIDNFHFEKSDDNDKVNRLLGGKVLSLLERNLKGKRKKNREEETLRVPVIVAMIKIMQLLPDAVLRSNLPRLIRTVCKCLKSYDREMREEAREALGKMALQLGRDQFGFLVSELKSTLVEGYQIHVLGYTLHYLLVKTESMHLAELKRKRESESAVEIESKNTVEDMLKTRTVISSALDEALPVISEILENELFGDIGEQKDEESGYKSKVSGLKEAKVSKVYDSYEILGRTISFLPSSSIHVLLEPLKTKMKESDDIKDLRKVEAALRRIAQGINKNQDVSPPHLLVYIHHIVSASDVSKNKSNENGLSEDTYKQGASANWILSNSANEQIRSTNQKRKRQAYEGIHVVQPVPQLTGRNRFENMRKRHKGAKKANAHLLIEHALELLLNSIKRKIVNSKDATYKGMMEPFVPLLQVICRQSKASRTMVLSLRCYTELLKWDLQSLSASVPIVCTSLFKMLKTVGVSSAAGGGSGTSLGSSDKSTESDTGQACIRALTIVIRQCQYYKISTKQLKLLVLIAQNNLRNETRQQTTFALLKSIVDRKLVVPEIYDLMIEVSELLYTASRSQVRHTCAQILIAFLVHYPLSQKRLEQHLTLIVGNLDFGIEDGRLAGLDMLETIINRFPEDLLNEQSEFYFFPLVLRLVNDDSIKCRTKVGEVIKLFLSRINRQAFEKLYTVVLKWFDKSSNSVLKTAAAQVVGLGAEVQPKCFSKLDHPIFESLIQLASVDINENMIEEDATDEGWMIIYHAVLAIHKLVLYIPSLNANEVFMHQREEDGEFKFRIELLFKLMLHEHIWVRKAASRLLGQCLAGVKDKIDDEDEYFSKEGSVFELTRTSCAQLSAEILDESLADQITKNLIWTITRMQTCNNLKGENWTIHRLSYLSRRRGQSESIRRACAFKCLAFIATQLDTKQLVERNYLVPILSPLFRYKDETLAKEVMELLESRVGSKEYLQAYKEVQKQVERIREERKKKIAMEKIHDPHAAAKRKVQKNAQKRAAKKRKTERDRIKRGR